MKSIKLLFASLALLLVATATSAQSLDSKSNANASAGSQSGSLSQNYLIQNTSGQVQYSGHFSQTQNAQVPISVVGYGSFSQASCITAIGGGATTRLFSFVYNGPKADVNCQHVVSGDAFGRATQLAMQANVPDMARASLAMVFFKYCTSDEDTKLACIDRGLIRATGKVRRVHGEDVAVVLPAKVLPAGAEQMAGAFGISIPSRPAGWTGVAGKPDYRNNQGLQAKPAAAPGDNPQASVMAPVTPEVPPPTAAIAGTYTGVLADH